MAKTVLFVLLDHYAEIDCAYLSNAIRDLSDSKVDVKTVSIDQKTIITRGGFTTIPDYKLKNIPDNYLGLVLVGSDKWSGKQNHVLFPIIEDAIKHQKVVAAIGGGSEFLAANGFYNTFNHTANGMSAILNWDQHVYTNHNSYRHVQSVRDGKMVSANSTASLEFARDTLRALEIVEERKISEWYALHKLGYCDLMMQCNDF